MPDIKDMLDNIIDGANNKFPNTVNSTMHQNMGARQPQTFDAGQFREKLSLYVLHDLISAMMHDDTKDIDGMIDASIMQHIRDDYGCGCYDYLCKCRDNTNSRVLDTVVQEIDNKAEEMTEKVSDTQDDAITNDMENLEKELPGIDSYQKLRDKLRKFVSAKVVEDVAKEVKDSTAAPDFSNLDKHVAVEKNTDGTNTAAEEGDVSGEDVQSESVCMNICHKIMAEAAVHRIPVTMEQAMELSFIEFCMSEMDALFKMDPMRVCLDRWQDRTPIQEAFWGRIYQETQDKPIQEGFFTTSDGHAFVRIDQQKAEQLTKQLTKDKYGFASRVAKAVSDNYRRYGIDEAYAKAFVRNSSRIKCHLNKEGSRYVLDITYPTDYVDSKDTTFISKIQRCIESEFRGYVTESADDDADGHLYQEDAKSTMDFIGKVAKKTGEMSGKILKKTGEVMKDGINGKPPSEKEVLKSMGTHPVHERLEEKLEMCRAAKKNYEKYFSAGSKKRPTDKERLEYRAIYDFIQIYKNVRDSKHAEAVKLKHPSNRTHVSGYLYTADLKDGLDHWYHNYDAYIAKRKESYSEQLDRELKQNGYREYATESADDDFFE